LKYFLWSLEGNPRKPEKNCAVTSLDSSSSQWEKTSFMKLSWHSLRVSIAGAKLSHLVQEDKIWDHGTMVEQVKNVFYKIEKAKQNGTLEAVKKYLGDKAYEQVMRVMKNTRSSSVFKNANVTEVSVIEVKQKNNKGPDRFTASIKGKRKTE